MKGLILKDFINLQKNVRIYIIFIFIYGIMSYMQEDASFFCSIFTLLFALLTLSSYSYDEMARWDDFALTTPISRETILKSKYMIMLLLTALGAGISIIFTVILNYVLNKENLFAGGEVCLAVAAISILYYSITIPIITKKGVEKARLIFIAIYMVPFVIGVLTGKMLKEGRFFIPDSIIRMAEFALEYVYVIVPVFLIIVLGISYSISLHIFRKKEF